MTDLETTQNQALRLIVGAVKTSPINAMLLLTKNKPIEEIIQQKALCLYEKLIRLPTNSYWRNYSYNQNRRLKTQEGFIQKVVKIKNEIGIPDILPFPFDPLIPLVKGRIDLTQVVRKKDVPDAVLKAISLETINIRYPQPEWLHVYTDGSRLDQEKNAGAGIFSEMFAFYITLGPNTTPFDGEVEAIRLATQQLLTRVEDFESAVILSDSISAIQAASSLDYSDSQRLKSCKENFGLLLTLKKNIVLQWIPSHCDIYGNEMADLLAKKGTGILQCTQREIPYSSINRLIKNTLNKNYQTKLTEQISDKTWRETLEKIPDFPRRHAVAAFRLETGHDCLAGYLHRFEILSTPNCILCNSDRVMDAEHLGVCPAVSGGIYDRYWKAREQLQALQTD